VVDEGGTVDSPGRRTGARDGGAGGAGGARVRRGRRRRAGLAGVCPSDGHSLCLELIIGGVALGKDGHGGA
jgi:hypothetical protein